MWPSSWYPGANQSIDLARFGWPRLPDGTPLREQGIIRESKRAIATQFDYIVVGVGPGRLMLLRLLT